MQVGLSLRISLLRLIATSAVFTLGICGVTMGCSSGSAGASSPRPEISSFVATPDSLTAAGGSVLNLATITNADSCTLSSTPVINGLPVTASCASGTVNENVAVPGDPTGRPDGYTFRLAATGATTTETKALKLWVAATRSDGVPTNCHPVLGDLFRWRRDIVGDGGQRDQLYLLVLTGGSRITRHYSLHERDGVGASHDSG